MIREGWVWNRFNTIVIASQVHQWSAVKACFNLGQKGSCWRHFEFDRTSGKPLVVAIHFQLRLPISPDYDTATIKTHLLTCKESFHTCSLFTLTCSLLVSSLGFVQVWLKLWTQGFLSPALLWEFGL